MSNFICPHCGMTNIDCGKDGFKTPREIELEINYEEQIRQLRLLNKELRGCLANDLKKLCVQKQEVLNEIENHLKNYLNMQNPAVNEHNDGFNTGIKTAAALVLNIIEKHKAQEAQKVVNCPELLEVQNERIL